MLLRMWQEGYVCHIVTTRIWSSHCDAMIFVSHCDGRIFASNCDNMIFASHCDIICSSHCNTLCVATFASHCNTLNVHATLYVHHIVSQHYMFIILRHIPTLLCLSYCNITMFVTLWYYIVCQNATLLCSSHCDKRDGSSDSNNRAMFIT